MAIVPGFAATAIFAGLALGLAAPASAVNQMSGHYIKTETDTTGQSTTDDFYFTPCGDGCASVADTLGGQPFAQARVVNGKWTMDFTQDATCPDGSDVPNVESAHFTWDPKTLAGTDHYTDKRAVCGDAEPGSDTNTVQFRKAD
jgi:hypothetical protein